MSKVNFSDKDLENIASRASSMFKDEKKKEQAVRDSKELRQSSGGGSVDSQRDQKLEEFKIQQLKSQSEHQDFLREADEVVRRATIDEEPGDHEENKIASFISQSRVSLDSGHGSSPPQKTGTGRGKSQKGPRQGANYNHLSEKERKDKLNKKTDENERLKEKQNKLEEHLKKMNTQLHMIENEYGQTRRAAGGEKIERKQLEELVDLKDENKRLREKLQIFSQTQEQMMATQKQKRAYKAIGQDDPPLATRDKQRVHDLVRLIDELKKRLHDSEEMNRRLQSMMGSKVQITTKDEHTKNQKLVGLQARYDELNTQYEGVKRQAKTLGERLAETTSELRDAREKLLNSQSENRAMEMALRNAQDLEAEIGQVRKERNDLEERLKELSRSPFFKAHETRVDQKQNIKNMEDKLVFYEAENRNLKEENQRYAGTNAVLQRELTNARHDREAYQQQNAEMRVDLDKLNSTMAPFRELQKMKPEVYLLALGEIKRNMEHPHYLDLPELRETQYQMESDKMAGQDREKQVKRLEKEVRELKQQNGELAAHLEKTETLLKTRVDIEVEKDRLHRADLEKANLQLKAALARAEELARLVDYQHQKGATEQGEMPGKQQQQLYSDNASVFSGDDTEETSAGAGANFLDLWIGTNAIEAQNLAFATDGRIKDARKLMTFLTIDFYNHETQHTNISEGSMTKYNFQVSFRVVVDDFLLHFLETNFLKLDVFATAGSDAIRLGSANIDLSELVQNNVSDQTSAVISNRVYVYAKNDKARVICQIEYRLRMRLPIFHQISFYKQKKQLQLGGMAPELTAAKAQESVREAGVTRRLAIVVDRATGLQPKMQPFVYYSLAGKDYYTRSATGGNPRWDEHNTHEVFYDEEFIAFLKQGFLTFTVFDDTVGVVQDVVGTAKVRVNALLQNQAVDACIDIVNENGRSAGSLYVKIFWLESEVRKRRAQDSLITKTWEQDITLKIAENMRRRQLPVQAAFLIFDRDGDQIINYEDFEASVLGTLNLRLVEDELKVYFSKLPQPLNQRNFEKVFKQYIFGGANFEEEQHQFDLQSGNSAMRGTSAAQLPVGGPLMALLSSNSEQIRRTLVENLRNRVEELLDKKLQKGVRLLDLFAEIDTSANGSVSIYELKRWLITYGIDAAEDDVQDFLVACDSDHDGKISLTEFFEFVLGSKHAQQVRTMKNVKGKNKVLDPDQQSWQDKALIDLTKERLLEFMHNKKQTFYQLHKFLDSNGNGLISNKEFRSFLEIQLEIPLRDSDIKTIMNYFDTDNDGKISLDELVTGLKREAKSEQKREKYRELFRGEREQLNISTVQNIVNGLALYMRRNKVSLASIFNEFDMIQKKELRQLLQSKMNIVLEDNKLQEFFDHFDIDRKNVIGIQEFASVLRPEIQKLENFGSVKREDSDPNYVTSASGIRSSKDHLEYLKKRAADCVKNNHEKLAREMYIHQLEDGYVSKKDFINLMSTSGCALTLDELDTFVEHVLKRNTKGNVQYIDYLRQIVPSVQMATGQTLQDFRHALELAKDVFGKIKQAIQDGGHQLRDAFQKFDQDGDGKIDLSELRSAFEEMGFTRYANDDELKLIMDAIDKDGDQHITFQEFVGALQLGF